MDNLLSQVKAESSAINSVNIGNISIFGGADKSYESDPLMDNLLSQVKGDIAKKEAEEELRKQAEIAREKQRQAEIKAQELVKLEKQAQEWLKKLDPLSTEGLWFEGFARNYPSKLAAAIDYLNDN
ncbi:hypothetical protein H6F32_03860 [Anabaena sp. FACHB-1237]|nr:hypothetical protein [Anabaena sp. FACHB-1237]